MLLPNASGLRPEVLDSRPVRVIEQALAEGRLGHALLLYGDDLGVLELLARHLAVRILNCPPEKDVLEHPDLLTLSPSGKMRQIRIGKDAHESNSVRALIHEIHLSPSVSQRKVALVREIDRMNKFAANALLKTLEEPPEDTTLLLLTCRPHDLLPTILSRCLNFRIPTGSIRLEDGEWERWLGQYRSWLGQLLGDARFGRERPADAVLPVYGLTSRFATILGRLDAQSWEAAREMLPEGLEAEQLDALKVGHQRMLRHRMFTELEQATRDVAIEKAPEGNKAAFAALAEAVSTLEHCTGLLEVNYNPDAALEHFLLKSLRLWSRVAAAA